MVPFSLLLLQLFRGNGLYIAGQMPCRRAQRIDPLFRVIDQDARYLEKLFLLLCIFLRDLLQGNKRIVPDPSRAQLCIDILRCKSQYFCCFLDISRRVFAHLAGYKPDV